MSEMKALTRSSILQKLTAFSHLVELTTVNRWITASLLGFFYFIQNHNVAFNIFQPLGALLGLWLVLCYVMAINDCFDIEDDKIKSKITGKKLIVSVEISAKDALVLSLIMLLLGLTISWFVSESFLIISLLIVGLSTLYSVPPIRYKRIFPLSTIGESVGALLPFLSGYAILGYLDYRALIVSVFFALITVFWRFFHEARFYEVDLKTGKTTFAVVYSPKKALNIGRVFLLIGFVESLMLLAFTWISFEFFILSCLYFLFSSSLWYRISILKPWRNLFDAVWGLIFSMIVVLFMLL
jgi:4-hydroxybenzoate polyprenyltransferase